MISGPKVRVEYGGIPVPGRLDVLSDTGFPRLLHPDVPSNCYSLRVLPFWVELRMTALQLSLVKGSSIWAGFWGAMTAPQLLLVKGSSISDGILGGA